MISFGRDNSIVLEIKDDFVDILVGNSRNILFSDSIPIPEGLCDGGLILDVSRLSEILLKYFLENDIDEKKLSFVAFGSDIVVRCIEIPSMNDEALREAMEFEIKEIIPNEEEYYIDYEVVSKNKENKKNVKLNVIVVACMKKKIDSYVELSKSLGKKLDVIDVLTNTINKVLLKSNLQYKNKAVAIFYLGYTFSNISISYDGVMNIERSIPFGFQNIIREFERSKLEENSQYMENRSREKLLRDLILEGTNIETLFKQYPRLKESIDKLFSIVEKTIKFYNTTKGNEKVSNMYIISNLSVSRTASNYIENYFDTNSILLKDVKELGLKVRNKNKNFGKFLPLYGLFLRRS